MADDHTDRPLSRRRLLTSLATIGGSLSAAGVGTWALFSDRERSDLVVRAGTVALSADDGSDPTVTVDDVEAGASGAERLELTNTGSLDASVVVCVDDVTVREGDSVSDGSPISGVTFKGCGQARVSFDEKPDSPVSVTFEHGDGSETADIGSENLQKDDDGWRYKHKRNGNGTNGYIERVTYDGRSWVNDDCNHVDESTGESSNGQREAGAADLADNVSIALSVDDETLIEDTPVSSLEGTCSERSSTTLGEGDSADLVVNWDAAAANGLAGEIEIDLTVTLQS